MDDTVIEQRVVQIPSSDSIDSIPICINSNSIPIQTVTSPSQNGGSSPQQTQFAIRTSEVQSDNEIGSPGQYYVMLPQTSGRLMEVPNNGINRVLGYDSGSMPLSNPNRSDHQRRQQHNEVERRRRDKINTWINKISKVVPDCSDDHTKQGQSKGGILAKAYEYILELQQKIAALSQGHNIYDKEEVDLLIQERNNFKSEVDSLRIENEQYRRAIAEAGVTIVREPDRSPDGK